MAKLTLTLDTLEVSSFEPQATQVAPLADGAREDAGVFDPFTHPRVTCLVRCPG